jgi:hypothetical protein
MGDGCIAYGKDRDLPVARRRPDITAKGDNASETRGQHDASRNPVPGGVVTPGRQPMSRRRNAHRPMATSAAAISVSMISGAADTSPPGSFGE